MFFCTRGSDRLLQRVQLKDKLHTLRFSRDGIWSSKRPKIVFDIPYKMLDKLGEFSNVEIPTSIDYNFAGIEEIVPA